MNFNLKPCLVCKSLTFSEGDRPTASVSDFSESQKAGCLKCGMILDAVNAFDPNWTKTHAADGSIQLGLYWGTLSVYLDFKGSQGFDMVQIFQNLDNPNAPRLEKPFLSCLEIVPNTRAGEAFTRISSWLAKCSSHHIECRSNDTGFMPSRVLDVSLVDDKEEKDRQGPRPQDEVRLFEFKPAESIREPAPYVALSYCWGSDVVGVIRTEKANLKAHGRGIPLASLPKTIQDAVLVSRELGIRYLWVDALCIVQDDVDDWQRESSQMHQIYSNSYVTVAAHAAVSCKDGFLGEQSYGQPSWQRTFTTEFWLGDANNFITRRSNHVKTHLRRLWLGDTNTSNTRASNRVKMHLRIGEPPHMPDEPSPLTRRGWTLQEAILPRRIVHYTGAELVWECTMRHFCECGHVEGLTSDRGTPMIRTVLMHGHSYDTRRDLVVDGWMRLVENYSARKLSFASDKLIALSGVAQMVGATASEFHEKDDESRLINSIYLAGVFRTSLPRHLLWHAQDRDVHINNGTVLEAHARPTLYRAPTWSWASIDTPIKYPFSAFEKEQSHVLIHDSESFCVPVVEADPTGAIKSGELLIEGLVVPVMLETVDSAFKRNVWDMSDNWTGRASIVRNRNGWKEEVSCDIKRPVALKEGDVGYNCWIHSGNWCEECEPAAEKWNEPKYCCLKVATYSNHNIDSFFCVLERSETVEEAWERIGIGMVELVHYGNKIYGDGEELKLFESAEIRKLRII